MGINQITIAGCGPGALELVTPAARHAIEHAEVLVGASRLLDAFPDVKAERIAVGTDIPKVLDEIAQRFGHRKIVVLVTGDPGLCSLARPVIRRFGRSACRVIPGISSVQAAFASVGVDWLGARILSSHDRAPDIDPVSLIRARKLAVLAGNPATAEWVEELGRNLTATHEIFVCENLTLPEEKVRQVDTLQSMKLASRSIVLFIRKETTP